MSTSWPYSSWAGQRSRARGCAVALAASILLHLLGAAGLRWLPHAQVEVHPSAPVSDGAIDVTVIEPAAREDRVVVPVQRDHRRGPWPRSRGDDDSVRGSDPSATSSEPAPAKLDSRRRSADVASPLHDTSTGDGPDDRPSAEIPRAEDAREGADSRPAPTGIDLSFEGLAATAKLRALPSAREDPLLHPSPTSARSRRSVGDLTAENLRQTAAEENVRRGRAHPLLFEYLRAARARLEPEATLLAEALPLGPALSMQGWGRGFLARVAEVSRKAAGLEPPDSTSSDPISGGRRPDLFPAYNEAARQAAAGAAQRAAEICLGVAPDRPVVVTLHRSSGHTALDQLAVDSFQKAASARPMAADVRPGLACYQVRISAFRVLPLPSVSFGIKKGRPEVIYPLKRVTKVTVELMSVDHGDNDRPHGLLRTP